MNDRHHLLCIKDSQLRQWAGKRDELCRILGSAVVLACLKEGTTTVTVKDPEGEAGEGEGTPMITVRHMAQHEQEIVDVWAWAATDGVGIAELSLANLKLLGKIVRSQEKEAKQR